MLNFGPGVDFIHHSAVLLTDRFSVKDVIGRTLVVHRDPDDFTTQPAGNAGKKIACGVIQPTRRGLYG